ncbi:hypothetical protein [Desulfovibrio sp. Huiquan2017]|uniref:hypothetical protein n=1 Tax=Desulfovibrio sp. Huiquan2017 TaxID=2816861 RepID=UPI00256FC127|nr:hypothetical protein [Desulfovibrio sp. Huiquan2017]
MSLILPADTPMATMSMELAMIMVETVSSDLRLLRAMFRTAICASKWNVTR